MISTSRFLLTDILCASKFLQQHNQGKISITIHFYQIFLFGLIFLFGTATLVIVLKFPSVFSFVSQIIQIIIEIIRLILLAT